MQDIHTFLRDQFRTYTPEKISTAESQFYNLYVEDNPDDERMLTMITGLKSIMDEKGEEAAANFVLELLGDFEQMAFVIGLHAGRQFGRELEPKTTDTYFHALHAHVFSDPPDYGDEDAHSILEMLYACYHEYNGMDNESVKTAFDELYRCMQGMSLREMDKVVDAVCSLCREHERAGFKDGIKVGIRLDREMV